MPDKIQDKAIYIRFDIFFNPFIYFIKVLLINIYQSISMFQQPITEQFKYPNCSKGGDHIGEILNLVCLQPKCIDNSIICGICLDQQHKTHKIKPLKMVITQSKKYLSHLTPMNIDTAKIKVSIEQTKNKILQKFGTFEKNVIESFENIKGNINAVFTKVIDQIELKTGSNDELLKALEQIKVQEIQYERFIQLMKKLLTGVPMNHDKDDNDEVSGKDVEKAVERIQKKVEFNLEQKSKKVQEQLKVYINSLQKISNDPSLFGTKAEFKFSNELKHSGVTLVSQKIIKSVEAYNYHFGLLEPSVSDTSNSCTVAFKINQNSSNWLGVGMVYKKIAQQNSFQFNYSNLGHGAYLVSCNGGSWSSSNASKNNVVNAFSYYTNDIILVSYEPEEQKILFKKKGTEETHTLEYEPVEGDELHFCGLFYYNNDQIEFMGHAEELEE